MTSPLQSPLQPVMRSPLEFRRRGGGFNIASTNPSAYYDRTVLATLFKDSAGTTSVTAVSQPIGLGLDQSGGGNNQIQATAGKRPLLSSRVNLLTNSVGLTSMSYSNSSAVVSTDQDGGNEARTITAATSAGYSVEGVSCSIGGSYTLQRRFKFVNLPEVCLVFAGAAFGVGGGASGNFARFNLVTGTVVSAEGSIVATITDTGGGWYMCTATRAASATGVGDLREQAGNGWASSTADKWLSYKPQIEYGPTATKYQWITTATNYDTVGFPTYADFDTVDDDLGTTFGASLGAGCTVCRSLPGTGASITTGVTLTATFTDNVDAHALLIYTAAQWAALDAGKIAKITSWLNAKAGL